MLASSRQAEDDLTLRAQLSTAVTQLQQAADAAGLAVDLALSRYRQGLASYLDVVDAQTAALTAQRCVIENRTRQLDANVDLIRASRGGWRRDDLGSGGVATLSGNAS